MDTGSFTGFDLTLDEQGIARFEFNSPERLNDHSMALAQELANGPQVAMRLLKRSLYNTAELPWSAALDEIAAKTAISDHHPDAKEGVAAFQDKRDPQFNAWLK